MTARRALAALVLLACACSTGGTPDDPAAPAPVEDTEDTEDAAVAALPTDPPTTATPGDGPTATAAPSTAAPDPAAARVALEPVATLDAPTAAAVRPDDAALYVAERAGTVRAVLADGTVTDPVVDLRDTTTTDGERGLLGLAWAPDGATLYLSFTDPDGANVLRAHPVADDLLDARAAVDLLRVPQPASNHNGGDVHVGPDGMLWWALGDGGAANDRFGNGQDPHTLLGALLRLDPAGGDPYGIPADNPFADGVDGAPEVWAYGLRNPWRFAFDDVTGDVWIADVGQDAVEEIDRVPVDGGAGSNFGWPAVEGDQPFRQEVAVDEAGPLVAPVHTYRQADRGCSITGGVVYRGTAIPELVGAYLFSDLCDGRIVAFTDHAGQPVEVDLGIAVEQPVGFAADPDGEVVVISLAGTVSRIVPG